MGNTLSDSSSDNESIDEMENEKYHKIKNSEVLDDAVDVSPKLMPDNIIDTQSEIIIEWKSDTLDSQ